MTQPTELRTFLWYNNGMQEPLNFYKQTFGEQMEVSEEILTAEHLFTAKFSIFGHEFIGMNTPGFATSVRGVDPVYHKRGESLWRIRGSNYWPPHCKSIPLQRSYLT